MSKKFIKRLSPNVALTGSYVNGALWNIHLIDCNGYEVENCEFSDGDLPSRTTKTLGGFTATVRVDLNLNRYYSVKDGEVTVWSDRLT